MINIYFQNSLYPESFVKKCCQGLASVRAKSWETCISNQLLKCTSEVLRGGQRSWVGAILWTLEEESLPMDFRFRSKKTLWLLWKVFCLLASISGRSPRTYCWSSISVFPFWVFLGTLHPKSSLQFEYCNKWWEDHSDQSLIIARGLSLSCWSSYRAGRKGTDRRTQLIRQLPREPTL